jgi:ribosome-associated protein
MKEIQQRRKKRMEKIYIRDDFIKLGQAMKLGAMVGSGVEAKILIQDGQVKVNGETCTMRGKKIYPGDIISFDGQEAMVDRNK